MINATPNSDRSSGSGNSSPRRVNSSLEIVRHIRDNPTAHIPKYHVFAEHVHRYKMRHCTAMSSSEEEQVKIKALRKWDFKHAGRPGEAPLPVGPRDEKWDIEEELLMQMGKKSLHKDHN
jgi:hypothetical protein